MEPRKTIQKSRSHQNPAQGAGQEMGGAERDGEGEEERVDLGHGTQDLAPVDPPEKQHEEEARKEDDGGDFERVLFHGRRSS